MSIKEEERNYKNGVLDGPYTKWHENGQKKMEVIAKDSENGGHVTLWHEKGNIIKD